MKIVLKRMSYGSLALLGILLLFIAISFTNHTIKLKKEIGHTITPRCNG